MSHQHNKELIRLLGKCRVECIHCSTACSDEEDAALLAQCVKLNNDCAEICTLAAAYLTRNSQFADDLLKLCADVCNACAEECEKHDHMEHCRRCAEICWTCAEACLQEV